MEYYIDINGKEGAKGTIQEPLKTLSITPKSGDVIYFKSGQIHFGKIRAVSGVTYAKYGVDERPTLSLGLVPIKEWKLEAGLWVYDLNHFTDFKIKDIGNIVFNTKVGFKRWTKEDCVNDNDFIYLDNKVYLKSEVDPNKLDIKLCITDDIIHYTNCENIVIDGLCLMYSGAHGINAWGSEKNIKISNCDFSYIGGGKLYDKIRYGNAVQNWGNIDGLIIENCFAHQIYDSAYTHQYKGNESVIQKNITIQRNIATNCWWGYEYYNRTDGESSGINVLNNLFNNIGNCWSVSQRNDKDFSSAVKLGGTPNNTRIFDVYDNYFKNNNSNIFTMGDNMNLYNVNCNEYFNSLFLYNGKEKTFKEWQTLGYDIDSIYWTTEQNELEQIRTDLYTVLDKLFKYIEK